MKDRNEIQYRVREERGRVEMVARRQCGLDVQKKEGGGTELAGWRIEEGGGGKK